MIATIVLGVDNASYYNDLEECRNKNPEEDVTTEVTTTQSTDSSTTAKTTTTDVPPPIVNSSYCKIFFLLLFLANSKQIYYLILQLNYRLPKTVIPTFYDLHLNPDLKTGLFTGKINITLKFLEITDEIVLHSEGLEIKSVKIYDGNNNTVEV